MKKNNIKTDIVKESLADYESIANSLKENTKSAVKSLLSETVKEAYAKMLAEADDDDYDEDEVEDTAEQTEDGNDKAEDVKAQDETEDAAAEVDNNGTDDVTVDVDDVDNDDDDDVTVDETDIEVGDDGEGGEDEWAEFDKYKVGEDEYDFTNAQDDEIVKVYKLLKNGDEVVVNQSDNQVHLQDNAAGTEYLLDLGGATADYQPNQENDFEDMNESQERLFELVLEYDSNVGYTDNYQNKDVMTNDGMEEPAKSSSTNDWDKGVPHGTKKPFSGYKAHKSTADKPFNAGRGKQVEEGLDLDGAVTEPINDEEELQELATVQKHTANVGSTSKTYGPNRKNPRSPRNGSAAGQKIKGTADNPYSPGSANESFERKLNKIVKENKAMTSALSKFRDALKEAAVVNYNLGKVISLISENTTTSDEKREIISRFNKEAKTVKESDALYESISRDLQKAHKMNITEDKQMNVEGSKRINETPIYKSPEVLESLDLMHRMMN